MVQPPSPITPLLGTVLDTIGREIVSGVLPTGAVFTLNDMSERFSISRTVAREVMRALEQYCLVASSRRVGLRVLPSEYWQVLDDTIIGWRLSDPTTRAKQLNNLQELRTALEPAAARLAAQHATTEQIARLRELAFALAEAYRANEVSVPECLDLDEQFHRLLLEATGNDLYAAHAPSVVALIRSREDFGLSPLTPDFGVVDAHLALVEAIAERNPDAAQIHSMTIMSDSINRQVVASEQVTG